METYVAFVGGEESSMEMRDEDEKFGEHKR